MNGRGVRFPTLLDPNLYIYEYIQLHHGFQAPYPRLGWSLSAVRRETPLQLRLLFLHQEPLLDRSCWRYS